MYKKIIEKIAFGTGFGVGMGIGSNSFNNIYHSFGKNNDNIPLSTPQEIDIDTSNHQLQSTNNKNDWSELTKNYNSTIKSHYS